MEENNELTYNKALHGNRYLVTLIIGAILFLLLSVIYTFSIKLAINIKNPGVAIDLNSDNYYAALSLIQLLYQVPLSFFFIFMLKDDLKNDFKVFKKEKLKNLIMILVGGLLCMVLTYVIASIYEAFGVTDESLNQETIDTSLGSSGGVFMAISVVVLAPFVEEMLFRKSFCDTLKYKFRVPDVVTIILSTLIFSLMHVTDIGSIIFIFQYIPLALVIVLSYYFSKTIYVPLSIHFINNLLSVVIAFLYIWQGQ